MKIGYLRFATRILPLLLVAVFFAMPASAQSPPQFSSFSWTVRLSLSKDHGIQTFVSSVNNPTGNPTIYAEVTVVGTDQSGINGFAVNSTTFSMKPGQTVKHIDDTVTFPPSDLGDTFSFSAIIAYGTTPTSLNTISNSGRSGTFTIVS